MVWEEFDTGEIAISQTISGFGLSWSNPIVMTSIGLNVDPSISVSSTGNAVANWTNLSLSEIQAVNYIGGKWNFNPVVISSDTSQKSASICFATDAFVTFHNDVTGFIQASNFNAGIWNPPVNLSTNNNTQLPVISVNSAGTSFIAWPDSGSGEICSVQYPTGGTPGIPEVISNGNVNFDPVISSGNTRTIAIWESYVGADLIIQANVN